MVDFFLKCFTRHKSSQKGASSASLSRGPASQAFETEFGSKAKNRTFSLEDLSIATRGFHPDNELGKGGFGSVYRGCLRDGTLIAVKKLSVGSVQGKSEFVNEVNLLASVQHRNLVKLLGCCVSGAEKLLVYEYVPRKSLDKLLFGAHVDTILDWGTRREIIIGTARGLSYLHEDSRERIVHRDIKASNILLDDKFCPKIADFGLAKLFNIDDTHVSTRVAGTFGYLAPEYAMNGKLTEKADVFSFGVVTLEVVSGRKHTDTRVRAKNRRLMDLAWRLYEEDRLLELADPRLGDRMVPEEVVRVLYIALLCIQANSELRPSMSKVVILLSGRSEIQEVPTEPPFMNIGNLSTVPRKPHRRTRPHETGLGSTSSSSAQGSTPSLTFSSREVIHH